MNPVRIVRAFVGRIRQLANSISQIGLANTAAVYANMLVGRALVGRLSRLLMIHNVRPQRAVGMLKAHAPDPKTDTVSVIIPTWNGMKDNIPVLLQSLRAQNWPDLEIIAVDSESTDETVAVLTSFGVRVIPIQKKDFRHDYARNLGAEQASGKYLLFTVQDANFVDPNWVRCGVQQLQLFGGKSYSTPQLCGPGADLYARYLSYNFIAANNYKLGANIFGNRYLGRLIYGLSDPGNRQRLIHVDDTNHLVERDYFLKRKYSIKTCEDMDFGRKVICDGEKFVFSTLSHIVHHHGYSAPVNYFTRVFLDNLVINDMTRPKMGEVERSGVIDAFVAYNAYMMRIMEDIFNGHEAAGAKDVLFDEIGAEELDEDRPSPEVVLYSDILATFEQRMLDLDDAMLITVPFKIQNSFTEALMEKLGLALTDLRPVFDRGFFNMLRDRSINHTRICSDIVRRRLNVNKAPLAEYKMYFTNLLIDVAASNIAWYGSFLKDEVSVTLPRLRQMAWV